jgi:hypothetical protein
MENKKLFRILSLIPEEEVSSYRVEFVNRLAPFDPNASSPVQTRFSDTISCLHDLFNEYFQNHIDLTYCNVSLKKGGSLELDCLGSMLFVKADLTFPILDKLVTLDLLGSEKPLTSVRFG